MKDKRNQMFQKNDLVTVSITDIGTNGEGIGKIDGYTLFIKDAVIGDTISAKIMKTKKNYGYARLEKVISPSSFRVEPFCQFAKSCGGCQLQAMSYDRQLAFKQEKVRNDLIRIGGFDETFIDEIMEPIIGMDEPYFYRNKAQYPIGMDKNGKLVAGFYAGHTHNIIANTDCKLGLTINQQILDCILQFMEEYHITSYDETTGKGLVRHVLLRSGFSTGEVMVCLVINGKSMPKQSELVERLCKLSLESCALSKLEGKEWKITSICTSSNTKNTNVIMGNSFDVLYGKGYITDKIGEVAFQISPLSFYQVNPIQTKKLYETALAYANLTGKESVWDLYCGIGTISLFLAQKAGFVSGVEIIPQAIDNARENAKTNQMDNVEFYVGEAEVVLPAYYEKASREMISNADASSKADTTWNGQDMLRPDVIVVDPPRKGCDERCLNTMVKMQPQRIVYVSCDPATLARDLKYLSENGYHLERVRAVDQFPQTVHVETVCLLSRKAPV